MSKPKSLFEAPSFDQGESAEASAGPSVTKLARGLAEFRGYIKANERFIPHYGERWRQGEAIATGFVESTVYAVVRKRFAKRQQMQWTPNGPTYSCWCAPRCSLASWTSSSGRGTRTSVRH